MLDIPEPQRPEELTFTERATLLAINDLRNQEYALIRGNKESEFQRRKRCTDCNVLLM